MSFYTGPNALNNLIQEIEEKKRKDKASRFGSYRKTITLSEGRLIALCDDLSLKGVSPDIMQRSLDQGGKVALARLLGVSKMSITHWCKGAYSITRENRLKIIQVAKHFDMHITEDDLDRVKTETK